MRIGIYGGTFNPIHWGHLFAATTALEKGLDKVIFVPAGTPYMKPQNEIVSAHHRLNMVKLAVKDNPKFEISDIECKTEGNSYTVDTLRKFKAMYPNDHLCLIVGRDAYEQMRTWKNPDEIQALADSIVIIERELKISSTLIRTTLSYNDNIAKYMLPPQVYDYIIANKLYMENKMFDAKKVTNEIVEWIRNWFNENGPDCNAIIGISGGKDSTVVAGLCVEALGHNRVCGVLMPDRVQNDIDDSIKICNFLNINYLKVNIHPAVKAVSDCMGSIRSEQATTNLPPRIRMATLYYISQCMNGRVANTCNYSEDYIGYSTKYGDTAGDFAPLKDLTSEEVIAVGCELGLPVDLLIKPPSDGLCGKTDEDNIGFTYKELNDYIRYNIEPAPEIKKKIDERHKQNLFKLMPMAQYKMER